MNNLERKLCSLFLCAMMAVGVFQPQVYTEEPAEQPQDSQVEQTPETTPEEPSPTPEPTPVEPAADEPVSEPSQPTPETPQPTPSPEPAPQPEKQQNTEPKTDQKKEEKEEKKEEEKYPAMTLTANAGGVMVTLQAPEGSLPEGTTIRAQRVGNNYVEAVENVLEQDGRTLTDAVAIDVTPVDKNGNEVQPKVPVTVTFSGANLNIDQEGSVEVYRVSDDASSVTQVSGGGNAGVQSFSAAHFTIYVAGASTRDPNGDGSNAPNSASHRYILEYGETVTLRASTSSNSWAIWQGEGVELSNPTNTSVRVSNTNETGTDQPVTVRHHRAGSSSIEYFYILAKAQTHTVTFYLQDAGASSYESVQTEQIGNGQDVTNIPAYPEEKTVDGKVYTFVGWYEDEGCTTEANFSNITADKNYYAKYELKQNSVTFMLKDAGQDTFENVHVSKVEPGGNVTDAPTYPEEKTVDGKTYVFEGWFKNEECTSPASLRNITEDQTVYARYRLQQLEVNFKFKDVGDNDFYTVHVSIVESGSDVQDAPTYPEEKTVDGKTYKFAGWFSDTACTIEDPLTNITKNQTVYARYAPTVNLTYHKNSGTDDATVPDPQQDITAGTNVTLGTGQRIGYELVAWNTKADGSGTNYSPNEAIVMPDEDLDLYAQWSQGTIKVTYWRNYNSSDTTVFQTDENVPENNPYYKVTGDMPTRPNYIFLGWSTTPDGSEEYAPKVYCEVGTEDVDLYAVWGPYEQETYLLTESLTAYGKTVYYNGEVQSTQQGVQETDNPQTSGPYKYPGWVRVGNKSGDNIHHLYAKTDNVIASGKDVGSYETPIASELYTHHSDTGEFEPLHEYIPITNTELRILPLEVTISTDSAEKLYDGTPLTAGGTYTVGDGEPQAFGPDGVLVLANGETVKIKVTGSQTEVGSSENGYELYWGDEATTANAHNYSVQTGTLGTLTVYYHEVKYDANAESEPVENMPADDSEVAANEYQIPANVPTRDHYDFTGWKTADGSSYQPGDTYTYPENTRSVTFVAQWEPKTVILTYDPNGGTFRGSTDPTDIDHDYDAMITIAEEATRDHYTFVGWNTKADGSGTAYQPGDESQFDADTTLYAIWKENTYTITYKDGQDGSVFADKTFSEDYGKPTPTYTPTEAPQYHTFDGWDPEPTQTVEGDATYTAKWKKNECPDGQHQWDDGVVTKEPTCTENGETLFTCTHCGETKTEPIPEALGHDWGPWEVVKEPTCTENGEEQRVCKRDPSHVQAKDIPALGHDPAEPVKENVVEPTCTQGGSYDEVVYCKRCGEELSRKTIKTDPLGHDPAAPVKENVVEPTCTQGGSYDEVVYCKRCGEELSRKTIKTNPLGHDWGPWETVKEPTNTEDGLQMRVCKRCGEKEYRKIPKKVMPNKKKKSKTPPTGVGTSWTGFVWMMAAAITGWLILLKKRLLG